jgi:hypothetical protein
MRRAPWTVPALDFIVIGAQKAGTTSLWRYLEDNPATLETLAEFAARPVDQIAGR